MKDHCLKSLKEQVWPHEETFYFVDGERFQMDDAFFFIQYVKLGFGFFWLLLLFLFFFHLFMFRYF